MSVTLTSALQNAQTVLGDRARYCLNSNFQAVSDLSHRATIHQLMAKIKNFNKIEGKATKQRLMAILGLIYPSKKEAPKKTEPFGAKKAAAMCKASVSKDAVKPPSNTKQMALAGKETKPLVKVAEAAEKEEDNRNQSFGNFERLSLDLRWLIAEYVGLSSDSKRMKFVELYKDLAKKAYEEYLQEFGSMETLFTFQFDSFARRVLRLHEASTGQKISDSYEIVLKHCKNLKEIGLPYPYDEARLKRIAQSLPPTIIIDFSNSAITDEGLETFVKSFPSLYGINLSCCHRLTEEGLRTLVNCKHLQVLILGSLSSSHPFSYVIPDILLEIARECKQLRSLDLSDNRNLSHVGLVKMLSRFRQLQNLCLHSCIRILDRDFGAIALACPELTSLDISRCHQLTDEGLQALAKYGQRLRKLDIAGCPLITDTGVTALAKECWQLHELILAGCRKITDVGLQAIAANSKLLRRLNLFHCKEITDKGVVALAENCKKLQKINLNECVQITDKGLRSLAENCEGLEIINIQNCKQITDSGLLAIASNCKNLKELHLDFCNKITLSGLKAILANCKQLGHLSIQECEQIKGAALEEVRKLFDGVLIYSERRPSKD